MKHDKMGRPRKHSVHDPHGKYIDGLSYDTANDTYFARYKDIDGKLKKENFSRNKIEAIAKFRSWQAKRAGGDKVFYEKPDHLHTLATRTSFKLRDKFKDELEKQGIDPDKYLDDMISDIWDKMDIVVKEAKLDEEDIWDYLRELIKDNPVLASQKLKIPALSNPEYLKDLKPPHTLKEIGDNYFNKIEFRNAKGEAKHELDKVQRTWNNFCHVVKVKTVVELTKERIKEYYDEIYSDYINKKRSTTWIRGHLERVKRVFNAAIKDFDNSSDISDAKNRCSAIFTAPTDETQNPAQRINKEQFHKILSVSNAEEKAMWFVSLNFAYYTTDVANLPLSAIDFENHTVIFRRGKTGGHRAAMLWNETIEAIREYQKAIPHRGKTLFFNMQDKMPYVANRIRKRFVAVLKTAIKDNREMIKGLDNLIHSNFRDSFQSICAEKHIPQRDIDAVMGHKILADRYTDAESSPQITEDACRVVHDYYFGSEANPKAQGDEKKS